MQDASDAKSAVIDFAIQDTLQKGKKFDFEGSMIRGVCEFNLSYNPEWETYYLVQKMSPKYRLLYHMKEDIGILGQHS